VLGTVGEAVRFHGFSVNPGKQNGGVHFSQRTGGIFAVF
jgi:hypothetical protein